MSLVNDILAVIDAGWLRHQGKIEDQVYDRLGCSKSRRKNAVWFVREGKYWCLGCGRRCMPADTTGIQLALPGVALARKAKVLVADLPQVSVPDLLAAKRALTVEEAAFCMGAISTRQVRYMVDQDILIAASRSPLRITSESVKGWIVQNDETPCMA